MDGGSVEHAALASAVAALLAGQLRGRPCRTYSADLRIRIAAARMATYADASVICDPVERDDDSPTHVTNPKVIIEVLSPSTESYDREDKRLAYQLLSSVADYVLVAQDRRCVEVWSRAADGWQHAVYRAGDTASLTGLGLEIPIDELYELAGVRVD
jgi:Uma2 family endonuclease